MISWLDGSIKRRFEQNRFKDWTLGYASLDELTPDGELKVEGRLPASLAGTFYRNGPARHERGDLRYAHRWDGDGLVQSFRFEAGRIFQRSRFVQTRKYLAENAANRFQTSAFGSSFPGSSALTQDIDDLNVANINVCAHGGELLALWEAGSAYRVDPDTLETQGIKRWPTPASMRPFSAHPKIDPTDGTLWNFGADVLTGTLSLYRIAADGSVVACRQFGVRDLPPLHDFAITEGHLVFLLPPLVFSIEKLKAGLPFAAAVDWRPDQGCRLLIISKSDWSQTWFEAPTTMLYHTGNAWEDAGAPSIWTSWEPRTPGLC